MSFITPFSLPKPLSTLVSLEKRTRPITCRLIDNMTQGSDEWHAARASSIGSSEAAAVFPGGISKTTTPAELFAKLIDPTKKAKRVFHDAVLMAMERGTEMEDVLRQELAFILGRPICTAGIFRTQGPPSVGYDISASPDGLVTDDDGLVVLAEFKWRMGTADWDGDLGFTVFCQVQHQMVVIGCDSAYVYCGAEDESRSLWLVQRSPSYFQMWTSWAAKLKAEVDAALVSGGTKKIRSEAGSRTQTEAFLALERRNHVVPLARGQLPQILSQYGRTVREGPAQSTLI